MVQVYMMVCITSIKGWLEWLGIIKAVRNRNIAKKYISVSLLMLRDNSPICNAIMRLYKLLVEWLDIATARAKRRVLVPQR